MRHALWLLALGSGCFADGIKPPQSDLVKIEGGTFVMGSSASCTDELGPLCSADAAPHPVSVTSFAIDRDETRRRDYYACVRAGRCPNIFNGNLRIDSDRDDAPALVPDPLFAQAYCVWRLMRLPTEAEFELAARGGDPGHLTDYPWGDDPPTCNRVKSLGCGNGGTSLVGTTAGDVNPLGVRDLAGSAPEWVADTYDPALGCDDHVTYADVCADGACAANLCGADAACVDGCLPPADGIVSGRPPSSMSAPFCDGLPADAPAATDPIVGGIVLGQGSGMSASTDVIQVVVRGGGSADRRCAMTGWVRRHAAPGSFAAGFRCVSGGAPTPTSGTALLRFALNGCTTATAPVRITAVGRDYTLVVEPPTGSTTVQTSVDGVVDGVPCGAQFVMHLTDGAATNVTLAVTDAGGAACQWSATLAPQAGGATQTFPRIAACACDPVSQSGCGPNQSCAIDVPPDGSQQGSPACIPNGTALPGQPCGGTIGCRGSTCVVAAVDSINGFCGNFCRTTSDCTAPAPPGQPGNIAQCVHPSGPVGLCTVPCNPVTAAGATGCPAGADCQILSTVVVSSGASTCIANPGTLVEGQTCVGGTFTCSGNLVCASTGGAAHCRVACRVGMDSDCGGAGGGIPCVPISGLFGACCPGGTC